MCGASWSAGSLNIEVANPCVPRGCPRSLGPMVRDREVQDARQTGRVDEDGARAKVAAGRPSAWEDVRDLTMSVFSSMLRGVRARFQKGRALHVLGDDEVLHPLAGVGGPGLHQLDHSGMLEDGDAVPKVLEPPTAFVASAGGGVDVEAQPTGRFVLLHEVDGAVVGLLDRLEDPVGADERAGTFAGDRKVQGIRARRDLVGCRQGLVGIPWRSRSTSGHRPPREFSSATAACPRGTAVDCSGRSIASLKIASAC